MPVSRNLKSAIIALVVAAAVASYVHQSSVIAQTRVEAASIRAKAYDGCLRGEALRDAIHRTDTAHQPFFYGVVNSEKSSPAVKDLAQSAIDAITTNFNDPLLRPVDCDALYGPQKGGD